MTASKAEFEARLRQIGAELGATVILEALVRVAADQIRINAQLIDVITDQHLWANSYDGTLEDAIGLQRTVAQAIAEEIRSWPKRARQIFTQVHYGGMPPEEGACPRDRGNRRCD